MDLWIDGKLYPKDPTTNAPPPFSNVTSLLHFLSNGKYGLLGYILHIESKASSLYKVKEVMSRENKDLHRQNQHCIQLFKSCEETTQDLGKK